jgi:FkbM family methyltransferase
MKILIYLTGGMHWLGGIQYTRNLLHALCLLPLKERPKIVLHIGRKNRNQGFDKEFAHYPNVVVDGPIKNNSSKLNKLRVLLSRLERRIFGKKVFGKHLLSDECSVAFPAKGPNLSGSAQKVFWVPDFQYKHFPDYFSKTERHERDVTYEKMFSKDNILVLSSEAVKKDFLKFFPCHKNRVVRILHFCSIIDDEDYNLDPIISCRGYGLPEKFVYLPNQMWQHKGFETVVEALGLLRKQGIVLPLVCTGSFRDYRNDSYYQDLEVLIKANDLGSQIYLLGLLPRQEQIQIFRRAAIVLQPSRFEGWSTSVEDARALGKRIILSDIDTHLEQDPPDAVFFITGSGKDLASKLKSCWPDLRPGPNFLLEEQARERMSLRGKKYAHAFMAIMQEADGSKSCGSESRDNLMIEESRIAALHHLLNETLPNKYFGSYYSKMLRKKREILYPAGQNEVRKVRSKTGLTFNINMGDRLGCDLYHGVFNEQVDCDLFMALISPGDVVIDIGANIGVYTLISALRVGKQGQVISFEPDSRSYQMLKSNVEQNKVDGPIYLSHYCLGDYNGTTSFFEAAEPCLSGNVITARNIIMEERKIPIKTLDTALSEMNSPKVSLIKIDVEGAESKVIAGAMGTLEKSDAILLVEISPKNLDKQSIRHLRDCLGRLEVSLNYQAFRISQNDFRLIVYGRMEEIFTSAEDIVGGNYFLARRTHGKDRLINDRFCRAETLLRTPHRFFRSRFSGKLSKEQTEVLCWAERERGLLAQEQLSLAYKRIEAMAITDKLLNHSK